MILRICFILLIFSVGPAFVIYIKRIQFVRSHFFRRLFLLPNVLFVILAAFFGATDSAIYRYTTGITLYIIAFLLVCIPEFLYALSLICSSIFKSRRRRRMAVLAGYILEALSFFVILCGIVACFLPPRVRVHTFSSPDVPQSFDGYRIVHLTDLHLGTFKLHKPSVRWIVNVVNAQSPDLIAFTGDLVNFDNSEIVPFRRELASFRAKDGVFSVLGNHDYMMYAKFAGDKGNTRHIRALEDDERRAGWTLLCNASKVVRRGGDSIAVIGSENDGRPPFPERGNLRKALSGVEKCRFKILLTHDPGQWRRKVLPQTDIQLTLSGHTHAGQLKIFGRSAAELSYKEWNGMYHSGNRVIMVSSGVGEAMVPIRLGAWPTVDVIILKHKKAL